MNLFILSMFVLPSVEEKCFLSLLLFVSCPMACGPSRMIFAGYPLVGGTRQRHFTGIHFKPHKLPENAQTPTSQVHAVLGAIIGRTLFSIKAFFYQVYLSVIRCYLLVNDQTKTHIYSQRKLHIRLCSYR